MSTLYVIRGGKVARKVIPAAGVLIPISRLIDFHQPSALPGTEDDEWSAYTLDQVVEIADRLTPWCLWFCSPGRTQKSPNVVGTSYTRQSSVWLSSAEQPTTAIHYALHEAMHATEDWLSLEEMETLGSGIHSVPDLPEGDWNRYYKSAIEVRAEAFAAWAYSYWIRGRMPEYYPGMPADERLWTMIYRGDLGLRVARRGLIPADRMSPALRERMIDRPTAVKLLDAVRHVGVLASYGLRLAAKAIVSEGLTWPIAAVWPVVGLLLAVRLW